MKRLLLFLFCILPLSALDLPDPRDQHYDFAHKTLVKAMEEKEFLETLQKKKTLYLKKLWKEAGKTARDGKKVSSTGLNFEIFKLEDKDIILVVTLPKTKETAEAKMVGARFSKGVRKGVTYTLEHGFEDRTILGGWNEGTHLNFGPTEAKTAGEFRDLILKQSE